MEKHSLFTTRVALIVFAKTPDAPVKTRIAQTEGTAAAGKIYRELLDVTARGIRGLPFHVAFTGNESPGALERVFKDAASFFPQKGSDLGSRMKYACLHCKELGFSRFIVIGCDCPERTTRDILQTARYLEDGCDVVLGPVKDGGYHLAGVGMQGLTIFDATQWSTSQLLKETQDIAAHYQLKTVLLPPRYDIDTIADYQYWKASLHRAQH